MKSQRNVLKRKVVVIALVVMMCISSVYTVRTPVLVAEAAISAPTGISIVAENGSATISWNAVSGAKTYALFMKDAAGNVTLVHNRIIGTSYSFSGLKDGARYGFVLKAYTSAGWSGYSSTVWTTCNVVSKAPENITVVPGDGEVTVSWSPSYTAQTYALFLKDTAGNVTLIHNRVNGTSYTVKGMKNGVRMGFVVKAYVNRQWSPWSKVAWATPTEAKKVPENLKANVGNDKITLTWDSIQQAEKYAVYQKSRSGAVTLLNSNVKGNNYDITEFAKNEESGFLVKAYVNSAWSSYSEVVWVKAIAPTPTVTPTPAPQIGEFPEIEEVNATMNADFLDSEEEVNRYLLEHLMSYYRTIYLYAEDISMLHTAEEYMEMYPAMVMEAEIRSLKKYINGYQMQICVSRCPEIDMEHVYSITTGDTSYLDEKELAAYEKLLAVNEALDLEGKSDIDKIVAVHDYLLLNVAYDEEHLALGNNPDAHYVEGTILQGKAVCSGYASTFRLFMLLQGINCEYVSNNGHGWNLIELDGEWYHMDVTWDDPIPDEKGRVLYTHFMMTDEMLATLDSHDNWECECGREHVCDDDSYIVYPYSEYVCMTEDEAAEVVRKQANSDMIYFVYPIESELDGSVLISIAREELLLGAISYYPEKQIGGYYLFRIKNK